MSEVIYLIGWRGGVDLQLAVDLGAVVTARRIAADPGTLGKVEHTRKEPNTRLL